MESDELEAPETGHQTGTEAGLDPSSDKPERARRLRRLVVHADSHSSLLSATRRLRRELPGDEQFGDPLSTAGRRPVEVLGRTVSSLQPDRKSVLAELGFAGLQVWQSLSEAAGRGRGNQEMAVMFTDLAGFSSWALKAGDEPALALLREVGARVESSVARYDGRIVKRLGDGVMATFLEAQAAIEAALDAQADVEEIEIDAYRPSMRVGLHWGSATQARRRLPRRGRQHRGARRRCRQARPGPRLRGDAGADRRDRPAHKSRQAPAR